MLRAWILSTLRGEVPPWPSADFDPLDVARVARAEGVVVLLQDRLLRAPPAEIPDAARMLFAEQARLATMESLLLERECRRLLVRLNELGIQVLLLKGSALAYWLYPSPNLRDRADIDLLFRSQAEVLRAASSLKDEYEIHEQQRVLPGDLSGFELTCVLKSETAPPVEIDLHWQPSSFPMFAFRLKTEELWLEATPLTQLGPNAFGLAPVPAFVHACMHRVQNIPSGTEEKLKWLYDIHLLACLFSEEDWSRLASLAEARGLAGICLDGIRKTESSFGTHAPAWLAPRLMQAQRTEALDVRKMGGWAYNQRMNFLAFPTIRLRLQWLVERLFPPRAYLRLRHGNSKSAIGLISARLVAGFRRLIG